MNHANEGKKLIIEVDGERFERIPVKTRVITGDDNLADVLEAYAKPLLMPGDIVFMSEKAVACTQRRAVPMKDIHPRPLAVFLSRHVYKNPYGIGLSIPQTMEMALQECGVLRILFAAAVSVVMKLFGKRGWFYRIAGDKARSIDGPCDCTIPPYNEYVVLGPENPEKAAREAALQTGIENFVIVDINDLGGNILGVSRPELNKEWLVKVLKDNPLGQSDEQTPIGIIRRVKKEIAREDIRAWINSRRDDFIADLQRIVRVKSISEPGSAIAPFGQGCRDALDEMLAICRERGLEVFNHEYYVGSAVLPGETDREIGIWSHLDVVPDSGEWQYPAFGAALKDGFVIGRGSTDNKGAAVMGLYCLLCARDLAIPLRHSLRVLFGTSEECGMEDIAYYAGNYPLPEMSLVPDAEFPVCFGEKGILSCELVSPPLGKEITGLRGGAASNMVADFAAAEINNIGEVAAEGLSKHAAMPEGSVNAIAVLCEKLAGGLVSPEDAAILGFVREIAADFTGAPLGIARGDEEFGPLTCVAGLLRLEENRAVLGINIRYPRCVTGTELMESIAAAASARCFDARDFSDSAPNYVPREGEFVKSLMESFAGATGRELPAYTMGGGTYARKLPNAVAFGPEFPADMRRPFPGLPDGHGGVHEPDEAASADDLLDALEIYMLSIKKADRIDEK